MILDNIISHKKLALARRKEAVPLEKLKEMLPGSAPVRPLQPSLRRPGQVAVIAETKRRSPSRGSLCGEYDCLKIAMEYEKAGAAAVSVLTEEMFFHGHPQHLASVSKEVGIPVLRKDFLIDTYQVYESRVLGADAVLLIAAVLKEEKLAEMMSCAAALGMECLVEVHTKLELAWAVSVGAKIIGINNRDLRTFETDLNRTFDLLKFINTGARTVVSESGIKSRDDILMLKEKGVHAALVGEALMQSAHPGEKLRELTANETVRAGGDVLNGY